ncbi:unnamed protein product [Rhizophagus irregularis]|uniref:Uncharacterized protein n=1 Tax=Rhizophagus irregularis TaxID=588596 RepID=A0A915ZYN1_9GLOM|nr:unnamed protein product [Rhizophagus irregularis]CAB5195497.1 unnamed protein product [Rhizophagus irregularis]CAB5393894.1 unnamed protein product [Rhizophagus irregularis]
MLILINLGIEKRIQLRMMTFCPLLKTELRGFTYAYPGAKIGTMKFNTDSLVNYLLRIVGFNAWPLKIRLVFIE